MGWAAPLFAAGLSLVGQPRIAAPSDAARRVLISIDKLAIPRGKQVYSFQIDTYGVLPLQTCHLPVGWEVKTQAFEDLEGHFSAQADYHGQVYNLRHFYLVDIYGYSPSGDANHPPSFTGWLKYGSRQLFGDWHGKKIKLKARNFLLRDASVCPKPPPPAP